MKLFGRISLMLSAIALSAGAALAGPYEDGEAAAKRGDYTEAAKQYRLAAEQGNPKGQSHFGDMYYWGLGGIEIDKVEAARLYRLAADQGDAFGESMLASMYLEGDPRAIPRNYTEALRLFRLAAAQGHSPAQLYIGQMYENGQGVREDYNEAIKWYRLAAEQKHPSAFLALGKMYQNGRGVLQDYVLAHMWYNLASINHPGAVYERDSLAKQMTPEQIAEAQKLAQECQRRNFKDCG